jgi:CBS domain-containing protein
MQVATILQNKGSHVHTIGPDETTEAVVAALCKHGIGALVVSSDGIAVDGIISERDIVEALLDTGAAILKTPVSELMTADVRSCRMDDTGREVLGQMTEWRVRHMPVVENGELCGMVSIGDAVKSRLDEVTHEAEALREYISQS